MYGHELKYFIITGVRGRDLFFWVLVFPIILGAFFKMAFGGIYEGATNQSSIPVAVVEEKANEAFHSVADEMSESEDGLLKVTYTDEKNALEMLKEGKTKGIFYLRDKLELEVSGTGNEETVLKQFAEQYCLYEKIITDTLENNPQKLTDVIAALSSETDLIEQTSVTSGDTDYFSQYFYNLIAMTALYGIFMGLQICLTNQANLSALAARKNCSPVRKSVSYMAALTGAFLLQSFCMIVCVTYIAFVLKVDFGSNLPLVYLAAVSGGAVGISAGFFIGSVGRMNFKIKSGVALAVVMFLCFLSGLMVGNMKSLIEGKAPLVNDLNPAAVISDSIYCLIIYGDYRVFTVKMATMAAYILLFAVFGILAAGRKKYASL